MTIEEIDNIVVHALEATNVAHEASRSASMTIIELLESRNLLDTRLPGGIFVRKDGDNYNVEAMGIDFSLETGYMAFGFLYMVWLDIKGKENNDN